MILKVSNKDLKCRKKQYKIGEETTEEEAILCKKGLHFCENPHDVFGYYSAGGGNRFGKVTKETTDEKEDDSQRVCKIWLTTAFFSIQSRVGIGSPLYEKAAHAVERFR